MWFFPNFAWLVTSQHYCSSSQTFLIKLLSGWHNRCKPQVSFLHFPMAYQDTQTDLPVFLLLLCPICSFSPPYLGLTAFLKCFASYHICTAVSFMLPTIGHPSVPMSWLHATCSGVWVTSQQHLVTRQKCSTVKFTVMSRKAANW